jgi:tRNA(Arg) A34 adenosine deaminase TadA
MTLSREDLSHLRESFRVAERARQSENHPFGAILADRQRRFFLEAGNSVVSDRDPTAHAERNLVASAHRHGLTQVDLAECTLYASTEPCPMCAGAIYWGGIGRVVFGLGQAALYELILQESGADTAFLLSCAEVLSRGSRLTQVLGPALEDEAIVVHHGFWATA